MDWLDPLPRLLLPAIDAPDFHWVMVGIGGGAVFGTYAFGWLALRDRLVPLVETFSPPSSS